MLSPRAPPGGHSSISFGNYMPITSRNVEMLPERRVSKPPPENYDLGVKSPAPGGGQRPTPVYDTFGPRVHKPHTKYTRPAGGGHQTFSIDRESVAGGAEQLTPRPALSARVNKNASVVFSPPPESSPPPPPRDAPKPYSQTSSIQHDLAWTNITPSNTPLNSNRALPRCATPQFSFAGDHGAQPKPIKKDAITAGGKSSLSLRMDDEPEALGKSSKNFSSPPGGHSKLQFADEGEGFHPEAGVEQPKALKRYRLESQRNAVLAPPDPIVLKEKFGTPAGGHSTVDLTFGEHEPEPVRVNPTRAAPGGGPVSVDLGWDETRALEHDKRPRYRKAVAPIENVDIHKHRYKKHFESREGAMKASLQHTDVDAELWALQGSAEVDVDAEMATIHHAVHTRGQDRLRHTWQDFTKFKSKSTLSQEDFACGLQKMGVSLQEKQVALLYKRFNKGNDGQMTYSEFVRLATGPSRSAAKGLQQRLSRSSSMSVVERASSKAGSQAASRSGSRSISRSSSVSRNNWTNGTTKGVKIHEPQREISV